MNQRDKKPYGALLAGDVFLHDGIAYQKLQDGTAYNPETKEKRPFTSSAIVEFIGYGIWPSKSQ